jgi:hypothetical protein
MLVLWRMLVFDALCLALVESQRVAPLKPEHTSMVPRQVVLEEGEARAAIK